MKKILAQCRIAQFRLWLVVKKGEFLFLVLLCCILVGQGML